jgi:hypothetical protein
MRACPRLAMLSSPHIDRITEVRVFQDAWDAHNDSPPTLFGEEFHLVPAPNRYDIPAFYELHAWIWKHNPSGLFEDWNPSVRCPGAKITDERADGPAVARRAVP